MEGQYMAFIYIIREPITYISYNILLERRPKSFIVLHFITNNDIRMIRTSFCVCILHTLLLIYHIFTVYVCVSSVI